MNKINKMIKFIIFPILFFSFSFSQTSDELKRFMDTYDKIKNDQQANEVVKKGIESEKNPEDRPVRLLVSPTDISKYYSEKMNAIEGELTKLNELLIFSDSIPPIRDFGYNYFLLRDSIKYIDNIKINSDYILGYGDEIIISVWGEVEHYDKKPIQRDGTVFIENVGLLYLGGKNIIAAKSYIFNRFAKIYSTLNSQPIRSFLDISVGIVKNINITVSGHVNYPGNYVVNPSITTTNLLILAGGIIETGSLRNIYLNRKNSIVDSIDLYPLISGRSNINDFQIYDGDAIVIPPKGETVALTGSVRVPAYYEIKNDNINSILNFAGGLNRYAKKEAYLYRNEFPNQYVNLNSNNNDFLVSGDSIVIPKKINYPEYITISVENRQSIEIPWVTNISYSNIFNSTGLDIQNVKKIELVRKINNNQFETYILQNYDGGSFNFKPYDYLSIQLLKSYSRINSVFVKGSVNSPGLYPLSNQRETLKSIINRSGGLHSSINISNVIIKRDTSTFGSYDGNLILTPGDTIIASPYVGTIKVEGEVHNPGNIQWSDNRNAGQYISLAGGLTAYGDKKHITYITPFGEAIRINTKSKVEILPGSRIVISQKMLNELNAKPDRFQQLSSLITSIVTIAILANSTSGN